MQAGRQEVFAPGEVVEERVRPPVSCEAAEAEPVRGRDPSCMSAAEECAKRLHCSILSVCLVFFFYLLSVIIVSFVK